MVHILDHETHTLVSLLEYKSLSPIPTTESLSPPTTEEDDEDEDALKIPKKRKQSPTQNDVLFQSATRLNNQKALQVLDQGQNSKDDQISRSLENIDKSLEENHPECLLDSNCSNDQTKNVQENNLIVCSVEEKSLPTLDSIISAEKKEVPSQFTLPNGTNEENRVDSKDISTKSLSVKSPEHSDTSTKSSSADGPCRTCHAVTSPHWRKGPEGFRTLCNACGLRWRKEKAMNKSGLQKPLSKPSHLLFHRKEFISHGLYSNETRIEDYSNDRFSFPLPVHQGQALPEKEFELPPSIWQEKELDLIKSLHDRRPVFIKIRANLFIERKPKLIPDERGICQCLPPKDEQELGCGEGCINRMLFYECDAKYCPCGTRCSNQRIQKKACDYRLEVFKTQGRGWGLRTQQAIQKGSFIIEYRGEIISQKLCEERMCTDYVNESNFYFLEYSKGEVIDACTKGTEARFINHSCVPNCHIEKWSYRGEAHFGVFASKDIPANSELSYDYNFSTFNVENEQACHCGSDNCRGIIGKKVKSQIS